jgi:hypothetical protein
MHAADHTQNRLFGCKGMAVKSIIRVLLMTAVVGGAFENHALADSISFKVTFGPTTSPFDMTYVFEGFDSRLGTLNDVEVSADETVTLSGSITNLSQYDAGPWGGFAGGGLTVKFANSAGLSINTPPVVPTGPLRFPFPFIPPNTTYLVDASQADVNGVDFTGTFQQAFEGGPVTATLQAAGSAGLSPPPDVAFSSSLTTSISGDFSVVYDYTPTPAPEPASGQMIAIGLAGLIAITRKTRRRRSRA